MPLNAFGLAKKPPLQIGPCFLEMAERWRHLAERAERWRHLMQQVDEYPAEVGDRQS
jgi:hypothetical protein